MTYRLTLDKLHKIKTQKTIVPEELRDREKVKTEEKPVASAPTVKVGS